MIHVQGLRRNVKNVVKNYSEAQVKVREATSNDPWGPSGTLMSEIADLTYNVVAFTEIMQVIWKRLNDHGKNWKHVYKALVLLEYLIKTGSEKVTQQCRENLFAIQTLRDFQYFEEAKDQGVNVREKAKALVILLKDEERLRGERARALKARERFARATNASITPKQDLPTTAPGPYGSSEFSQGSFDEDMMSPGGACFSDSLSLSELEHARPQTAGEEELQLQLALAMSKEEADQAERIKRNDDLRLQMALSESEEEFKKTSQVPEQTSTLQQSSSAMEDLLGLSLNTTVNDNSGQVATVDPWGFPLSSQNNSSDRNVWNTDCDVPEQNKNMVKTDLWGSSALDNSNLQNSTLFTASQDNISETNTFDLTNMKKSLSADVSCTPALSGANNTLDTFLSPESSLINLDSTSVRSRTLGNPFQAAKPSPLTINELRAQNSPQTVLEIAECVLPMSNSMPLPASTIYNTTPSYGHNNVSPSQNPFM